MGVSDKNTAIPARYSRADGESVLYPELSTRQKWVTQEVGKPVEETEELSTSRLQSMEMEFQFFIQIRKENDKTQLKWATYLGIGNWGTRSSSDTRNQETSVNLL